MPAHGRPRWHADSGSRRYAPVAEQGRAGRAAESRRPKASRCSHSADLLGPFRPAWPTGVEPARRTATASDVRPRTNIINPTNVCALQQDVRVSARSHRMPEEDGASQLRDGSRCGRRRPPRTATIRRASSTSWGGWTRRLEPGVPTATCCAGLKERHPTGASSRRSPAVEVAHLARSSSRLSQFANVLRRVARGRASTSAAGRRRQRCSAPRRGRRSPEPVARRRRVA